MTVLQGRCYNLKDIEERSRQELRSVLRWRRGLPNRFPDGAEVLKGGLCQIPRGRCMNSLREVAGERDDHDGAIFKFTRLPIAVGGAVRFRKVGEENGITRHGEFPHILFKILLVGK